MEISHSFEGGIIGYMRVAGSKHGLVFITLGSGSVNISGYIGSTVVKRIYIYIYI